MNASLNLQSKWVTELYPFPPFNFDASLHKPDHFPSADNAWEPGVRWQTMLKKIYTRLFYDPAPEEPEPVEQLIELLTARFRPYRALAVHYVWEDLFWKRKHAPVAWLEELIRL